MFVGYCGDGSMLNASRFLSVIAAWSNRDAACPHRGLRDALVAQRRRVYTDGGAAYAWQSVNSRLFSCGTD